MSAFLKKRKRMSRKPGPRSLRLSRRRRAGRILAPKQKPPLKPSDLRKRRQLKKRNSLLIKIAIIIFLALCLLLSLWIVLRAEGMRIQRIDVRNKGVLAAEDIEEHIVDAMKASGTALFPGNNTLFIPITEVESSLKETFLRIGEVNILRKGFSELIVVVEERSPELIYCEYSDIPEGEHYSGDCYFADPSGMVYSTAPYIPRSEFKIIFFSAIPSEEIIGETPLESGELLGLNTLVETLETEEIGVTSIHLVDQETLEIETGETYSLLVAVKGDYTDELERFFSALKADIFDEEMSLENVYEFDLRFGRKVFYRYTEAGVGVE